jgi:hypothetical protein
MESFLTINKYMITLAFLFVFLLSVSIAALTVSPAKQEQLLRSSWQRLGNQTKDELQVAGNCCGFHVLAELANTSMSHPPCTKVFYSQQRLVIGSCLTTYF